MEKPTSPSGTNSNTSKNARINQTKSDGQLNIHKAAFRGNLARIEELINEDPTQIHNQDPNGSTALHHACYKGFLDCVTLLLDKGANVDATDKDLCTPLHNASFTGKSNIVQLLLERGANPDHQDVDASTAVHKAAFAGNIECVEILVRHNCNVNWPDKEGITCLQKATYNAHFKCLEYLIEQGANVDVVDLKGSSCLHKAAFNGNIQCVNILLKNHVNVNVADHEGTTPLHNAAYNGHIEVVQALLAAGANPNVHTTKNLSTPLHFAAFNGYMDCIKALTENEANLEVVDIKQMTPLHYAVKREHEDCVQFLLDCGADANAVDYKGRNWRKMTNSRKIHAIFSGEGKASLRRDFRQTNEKISEKTAQKLRGSPTAMTPSASSGSGVGANHDSSSNHNVVIASPSKERSNSNTSTSSISKNGSATSVDKKVVPNPPKDDEEDKKYEIYQHLDRNGFVVDDKNAADDDPEAVQREIDRAMKWSKMIQKWDAFLKKDLKKVRIRCEKGIPARVRGQAWKLLARSTIEYLPVRKMTQYKDLLQEESEEEVQINKDLNRTFPKNILLMQKGGQQALFNVLKAYAVYNKEVGYCQSMAFVCAMLLMHMDEEDAFWMIHQLCTVYEMGDLWRPTFPGLKKSYFVLEQLMDAYIPKVYQHLQKIDVSIPLFAMQWFLTMFLYNLPFPVALRIMDVLLFEGFHIHYAVALALMKMFENEIVSRQFDEAFSFLQFYHNNKEPPKIDVEQLMKLTNGLKDKIKRSLKSYEAEYANLKSQNANSAKDRPASNQSSLGKKDSRK